MGRVILIAEDEPIIRMAATDTFERAGFDVIESANSSEALKILSQRKDIDLLFTDVHMPGGVDGIALAQQVCKEMPKVKVVIASGKATPRQSELPPGVRFMVKPYSYAHLIEAVKEILHFGTEVTPKKSK